MGVCQSQNVYGKWEENSNIWFPEKPLRVKWKITQIHLHFSHFQLWIWRCSDSTNEPSMSALPPGEIHPHPVEQRGIFLMLNAPYKTETSQPTELKPGYWYWLRISSASSTLQFWLASQFFTATFEPCDATAAAAAAAPPRSPSCLSCWRYGCFLRRANSAEAAFSWTELMDHDSSVPPFSPQKPVNSSMDLT